MPKDVYAYTGSRNPMLAEAKNTHRQCAERVLMQRWVAQAWRHGVTRPGEALVWMKRKSGGLISIVRPVKTAEGGELPGCSAPCVFCRKALLEGGFRAEFVARSGNTYRGHMSGFRECSVLTGGYAKTLTYFKGFRGRL